MLPVGGVPQDATVGVSVGVALNRDSVFLCGFFDCVRLEIARAHNDTG